MTQTYPTMQWNTRERALSNDLNKQARLVSRGITETATAIVSGTLRKAGIFGAGFLVTPMAGTMKSTISPGTALFVDGVSVYPDSTVQWVESTAIREVTHEASDASTRFDVVEMRPGTMTVSTEPRDEFNPVTGTFVVTNMVKEVTSYPEFQVRKGTPSATPSIPAGVAGWMGNFPDQQPVRRGEDEGQGRGGHGQGMQRGAIPVYPHQLPPVGAAFDQGNGLRPGRMGGDGHDAPPGAGRGGMPAPRAAPRLHHHPGLAAVGNHQAGRTASKAARVDVGRQGHHREHAQLRVEGQQTPPGPVEQPAAAGRVEGDGVGARGGGRRIQGCEFEARSGHGRGGGGGGQWQPARRREKAHGLAGGGQQHLRAVALVGRAGEDDRTAVARQPSRIVGRRRRRGCPVGGTCCRGQHHGGGRALNARTHVVAVLPHGAAGEVGEARTAHGRGFRDGHRAAVGAVQ